jgi:hypothetical protein
MVTDSTEANDTISNGASIHRTFKRVAARVALVRLNHRAMSERESAHLRVAPTLSIGGVVFMQRATLARLVRFLARSSNP